jgi:hypothetical protein
MFQNITAEYLIDYLSVNTNMNNCSISVQWWQLTGEQIIEENSVLLKIELTLIYIY